MANPPKEVSPATAVIVIAIALIVAFLIVKQMIDNPQPAGNASSPAMQKMAPKGMTKGVATKGMPKGPMAFPVKTNGGLVK